MAVRDAGTTVRRFLGPEAVGGGPFALLGVAPGRCTDEAVLVALERQLERVAQHPEAETPEADEVRLALHAAAAQLLDRGVRRHLEYRWRESGQRWVAPQERRAAMLALEHDAVVLMALHGGWTPKTLRRLAGLAYARGLSSSTVAETMRHLAMRRGPLPAGPSPSPSSATVAAPSHEPRTHDAQRNGSGARAPGAALAQPHVALAEPDPQDDAEVEESAGKMVLAGVGVGLLCIAVAGGLAWLIAGAVLQTGDTQRAEVSHPGERSPGTPPQLGTADRAPSQSGTGDDASIEGPESERAEQPIEAAFTDGRAAIRALREAVDGLGERPEESADRFVLAVRWVSASWCRMSGAQVRAANDAVLEFVYASAGWPELSRLAFDAITEGAMMLAEGGRLAAPRDVWRASWSAGMLTRIGRERELPAEVASRVQRALAAALAEDQARREATFESGAAAGLRRLVTLLTGIESDVEAASRRWIQGAEAITGPDVAPYAESRERLLVEGLERLLMHGGSLREGTGERVVLETLAVEIRWRRAGPARVRLLDWFRDSRIDSRALAALTNALATRSAAEGVDPTMTLSPEADRQDRLAMRSAYAQAWGVAEATRESEAWQRWNRHARDALSQTREKARRPVDELRHAVVLSLLNESADLLWRGESAGARRALERAQRIMAGSNIVRGHGSQRGAVYDSRDPDDGQWAVRFIAAGQNIPVRLELLNEMNRRGDGVGPVDAAVLVEAAYLSSPAEVRYAAQQAVARKRNSAAVLSAMLQSLPLAPKIRLTSEVIEEVTTRPLPAVNEAGWEMAARRALVERLLELMATHSAMAEVDALAEALGESYARRAGLAPSESETDAAADSNGDALESVVTVWEQWLAEARLQRSGEHAPASLDTIERRLAGRAGLAVGPVQSFAAEQGGVAELMAYVVANERPSAASAVRVVYEQLAWSRRQADNVFLQIKTAERAMLRLWLLRIGDEEPAL